MVYFLRNDFLRAPWEKCKTFDNPQTKQFELKLLESKFFRDTKK